MQIAATFWIEREKLFRSVPRRRIVMRAAVGDAREYISGAALAVPR
jgi:hypothetical protein